MNDRPAALLLPTQPWALAGMLAALLNAVLRVAIVPVLVVPVFDEVLGRGNLSGLGQLLGVAALVTLGGALALFFQDALLAGAAARVAARWRAHLLGKLLGLMPGGLPGSSGGLAGRVVTDLREIEIYYQYGLGTLVAESGTLLFILVLLFRANASAAVYLLVLIVPAVLVSRLLGQQIERVAMTSQAGVETVSAQLQESLKLHELVRAFAADRFVLERFKRSNDATATAMTRRYAWASLQLPVTQVLVFVAVGVLLWLLSSSVRAGSMTVGEVVAFITLTALLSTPAQLLPRGYAHLQQARAASKRLNALLTMPDKGERVAPTTPVTELNKNRRLLELDELSFRYGVTPVLTAINLRAERTGLLALAGESGAGKTTLLKLLLGFLRPSAGQVLLVGRPLASYPEVELRRLVAYVPQEAPLFKASLRANLCFGRDYSDAQLWHVLAEVSLADTVTALPGQLDYAFKDEGEGLSGGQKQRIAIARALLGEPALLLLDEPTSSLDARSEAVIVSLLKKQAEKRLVLTVAHRPALIEAADQVFYLEAGKLKTHNTAGA